MELDGTEMLAAAQRAIERNQDLLDCLEPQIWYDQNRN